MNIMKRIVIFIFLLLFSVKLSSQDAFLTTNKNTQQFANENLKSISSEITRIHLEMIFNDLIAKNHFSKKQVAILNNFQELVDFKMKTNGYSFEAMDKNAINLFAANRILFWRMDVTSSKALYEFYVTKSENDTQKLSYAFVLEKETWKIIRN